MHYTKHSQRTLRRLLVVLAVGSLIAAAIGAGASVASAQAGDAPLTIDADNPLTSDDAIAEFRETGSVTRELSQVNATITVAEQSSDANLGGPFIDSANTYVRINYNEELERTLRIYLPAELVTPRPKYGHPAVNADAVADFEPSEGYQSVELTIDGETDATWVMSKTSGAVFDSRRWVRETVANVTGFDVPSLAGGADWEFIKSEQYGPESPAVIETAPGNLTMQYRTVDNGEQTWLPLPECTDPADQPACYYASTDDTNATSTVIMTTNSDPPRIRYKEGVDSSASATGIIDDLAAVPDRIDELLDGVFGGDSA